MNPTELVSQGLQLHSAGNLDGADRLYVEALLSAPNNPDALHLRGVIAHQRGHHQSAIELISRAAAQQPRNGAFLNNLGESYRA